MATQFIPTPETLIVDVSFDDPESPGESREARVFALQWDDREPDIISRYLVQFNGEHDLKFVSVSLVSLR
jgi:hypothetical protein